MLGYKENHGLIFPAVPAPTLLFLYIRDLALPRRSNFLRLSSQSYLLLTRNHTQPRSINSPKSYAVS
jgi:RNA polymerase I-specific transcription initiation factor RRN7